MTNNMNCKTEKYHWKTGKYYSINNLIIQKYLQARLNLEYNLLEGNLQQHKQCAKK